MIMAATAISLQLRPIRHRLPQNPNFIHFFSSSSSFSDDESPSSPPESQPQSFASYFNNVKSSLKQTPSSQQQQQQPHRPFYPSSSNANESLSRVSSIEEVRRNLSGYRRRATTPPPPNLSQPQPISFQELYQRSVSEKNNLGSTNVAGRTGQLSLNEIRQSLVRKTASPQSQVEGPKMMSLDRLKEGLKLRQQPEINDKLTLLVETETRNTKAESDATKTKFLRSYSYIELGNKLKTLRPDGKGKNCFSLTELNERLTKMRELEDKETDSRVGGPIQKDFRECLIKLSEGKKNSSMRFNVLSQHGKNAEYMLKPPKKELVEKYFHPDNMSSSEKLKFELKRVRDEFKISESDCGSTRVQVAQLTTKIKHLSAGLHKKDKHSRKGLQGMVQQRKKLLKYLRRTDWDSYCLVLYRLGLRDNPDYKN